MNEELLYAETDNACAICGARWPKKRNIHHIGDSSKHTYDNCIVLCYKCHDGFHKDGVPSKDEIKERKRQLIVKTLTQYGVNAMKIAARNGCVPGMPFLLYHLVELGFLLQGKKLQWTDVDGVDVEQFVAFNITDEGRKLLDRWRL